MLDETSSMQTCQKLHQPFLLPLHKEMTSLLLNVLWLAGPIFEAGMGFADRVGRKSLVPRLKHSRSYKSNLAKGRATKHSLMFCD